MVFLRNYPPSLPVEEFDGVYLETVEVPVDDTYNIFQIASAILDARGAVLNDESIDDDDGLSLVPTVTYEQERRLKVILTVFATRTEYWRQVLRRNDEAVRLSHKIGKRAEELGTMIDALARLSPGLTDGLEVDHWRALRADLEALKLVAVDQEGGAGIGEIAETLLAQIKQSPVESELALTFSRSTQRMVKATLTHIQRTASSLKGADEATDNDPLEELVYYLIFWWREVTAKEPTFTDKSGGRGEAGKTTPFLIFVWRTLDLLPNLYRPARGKGRFGLGKDALNRKHRELLAAEDWAARLGRTLRRR